MSSPSSLVLFAFAFSFFRRLGGTVNHREHGKNETSSFCCAAWYLAALPSDSLSVSSGRALSRIKLLPPQPRPVARVARKSVSVFCAARSNGIPFAATREPTTLLFSFIRLLLSFLFLLPPVTRCFLAVQRTTLQLPARMHKLWARWLGKYERKSAAEGSARVYWRKISLECVVLAEGRD